MNCGLVRRHLGALLDGELDPTTLVEFERHLNECMDCQEFLDVEENLRREVRTAVASETAPAHLKARLQVDLEKAPQAAAVAEQATEPLVRPFPMRLRYAVPMSMAAAILLIAGVLYDAEPTDGGTQTASATLPVFQELVEFHRSSLPPDVGAPVVGAHPQPLPETSANEISGYFRGKVSFPVKTALFDRQDVRLVGGRLSNVRERRAAALYYDVQGRRMTVVVFEHAPSPLEQGALRARFGQRDLFYHQVGPYTVPVRYHDGLTYAFTGDLGQDALLQLAATSRIRH